MNPPLLLEALAYDLPEFTIDGGTHAQGHLMDLWSCLHDATWRLRIPLVLTSSSYGFPCGRSIAGINPKVTKVWMMEKGQ